MKTEQAAQFIDQVWGDTIVPILQDYIRIPNTSPHFDPQWAEKGFMNDAVDLACRWGREHLPRDATIEVVRLEGRTPLLLVDCPGQLPGDILFHGHLDKQPETTGWAAGCGPWVPVLKDHKLYGRGVADDGYGFFATLAAICALQDQGVEHARCMVLIECCEESGSNDLPPYLEYLSERLGNPDLVICLDSNAGNYEQLWLTTSLRGLVSGTLDIQVLREAVHSGKASGVVASSLRIARMLLDRIEDAATGDIRPGILHDEIPSHRVAQAKIAAAVLGSTIGHGLPFVDGMASVSEDLVELLLNRTWRPALTITGMDGVPCISDAGNVVGPGTSLKLSLRTSPMVDAQAAYSEIKTLLEMDPPYGAAVNFEGVSASGWHAAMFRPWLHGALDRASQNWFSAPAMYMGQGGTMPFVDMLGKRFPRAQFVITGVLGPNSNAHGPNEFLHLPTARKLTGCIAQVIADHGVRQQTRRGR